MTVPLLLPRAGSHTRAASVALIAALLFLAASAGARECGHRKLRAGETRTCSIGAAVSAARLFETPVPRPDPRFLPVVVGSVAAAPAIALAQESPTGVEAPVRRPAGKTILRI